MGKNLRRKRDCKELKKGLVSEEMFAELCHGAGKGGGRTKKMDCRELKKGLVSEEMFVELCHAAGKGEKTDYIRSCLLALGIAVETMNRQLFIPALVSDFKLVSEERKVGLK